MNIKELKDQLPVLQSSICSNLSIDDAIVEIIEIVFDDKPGRTYYPPHIHTWYEFNYILSGSMVTILNNSSFKVNAGEYFLVPPQTEHAHRYNPQNPHEGICMRWKLRKCHEKDEGGKTYELLDNLKVWNFNALNGNHSIRMLLLDMFADAAKGYYPISIQLNFIKIMTTLAEINKSMGYVTKAEADYAKRILIKKVEVFLMDNIRNDIDVHEIAAALHLSYGYFARVYKKYTGQTIMDRMCQIRLEKAVKLMEKPDIALKEIAELSGFPNQYYFSNVFKSRFGISPKNYRKTLPETTTD